MPSSADWETLRTFLGGEAIAGGKLKEIGTTHWDAPNAGATDEYGFKALGGGLRDKDAGAFLAIRNANYNWSSTEVNFPNAYRYGMTKDTAELGGPGNNSKKDGYSVRCMRDV